MERQTITLYNPVQAHKVMQDVWVHAKAALIAGNRLVIELRPEKRSNEQNRRLWAMLGEVAKQIDWYGQKLTADDWKTIFTAALKKERVVPGINGGFVVLGQSTSKMTKSEMCDLQTIIEAFGEEKGVVFVDSATGEVHNC